MPATEAAKTAAFEQFFMSNKGGRKHLNLSSQSVVDELLYGRDTDGSGADPHGEYMKQFDEHAGVKSGGHTDRPFRKPGMSMASTMDDVIWGRDFDKSGSDPYEEFLQRFPNHAGVQSNITDVAAARAGKRAGYALSSTMDSVIWGRDFDGSGEDPHQLFEKNFQGHAGKITENGDIQKPFRRILFSNDSAMRHIITGLGDYEDPHTKYMDRFEGYAGVKAGNKEQRPFRKPGLSLQSNIDEVIWGRDLDKPGGDMSHEEFFLKTFADHAGKRSGHVRGKSKVTQYLQGEGGSAKQRSRSAPPRSCFCHGSGAATDAAAAASSSSASASASGAAPAESHTVQEETEMPLSSRESRPSARQLTLPSAEAEAAMEALAASSSGRRKSSRGSARSSRRSGGGGGSSRRSDETRSSREAPTPAPTTPILISAEDSDDDCRRSKSRSKSRSGSPQRHRSSSSRPEASKSPAPPLGWQEDEREEPGSARSSRSKPSGRDRSARSGSRERAAEDDRASRGTHSHREEKREHREHRSSSRAGKAQDRDASKLRTSKPTAQQSPTKPEAAARKSERSNLSRSSSVGSLASRGSGVGPLPCPACGNCTSRTRSSSQAGAQKALQSQRSNSSSRLSSQFSTTSKDYGQGCWGASGKPGAASRPVEKSRRSSVVSSMTSRSTATTYSSYTRS